VRAVFACVVIVVACLLAPVAVVAAWADDEIVDGDRFVATLAPLSSDPAVQDAIADRVARAAVEAADVPSLLDSLRDALGGDAGDGPGALSGPIEGLLGSAAEAAARAVVSGPAFEAIWTDALRLAHTSALRALRGDDDGAVTTEDGDVVLDLNPIVERVRQRLVDQGIDLAANIPDVDRSFVLLHGEGLEKSRTVFRIVDGTGTWLPVVVLALFVLGVLLTTGRRRALMWSGVGVLIAMVVLGVALSVLRRVYLDDLPGDVPRDAAAAVYDALVRFLRDVTRTVAVVAAALAVAAYVAGPGRAAGVARRALAAGPDTVGGALARAGLRTGSVGRFVAERRTGLFLVAGLLAGVWLVVWNHPTVESVLVVLAVLLAVLAVLETIAAGAPTGTRDTERVDR